MQQLLRFIGIGGSATVLQFVLLILFVQVFGINEVGASALSYALSAVYNYLMNYYLTFKSRQSHWHTAPRFAAVCALGLGCNTLVFALVFAMLPLYLIAQCVATAVTLCVNFLLHRYWIYRGDPS